MPVPAWRSAAVRAATAVPITRKPPPLPAKTGGAQHGRFASPGLSDDQVVAVAGGEQCPHPRGLFRIQVSVEFEDLIDDGGIDPGRPFSDPGHGGPGDPLLGGEQFGGRIAAIAGRFRDLLSRPGCEPCPPPLPARPADGPRRVGSSSSSARATASVGVTSNALATALMASRRVKVEPAG